MTGVRVNMVKGDVSKVGVGTHLANYVIVTGTLLACLLFKVSLLLWVITEGVVLSRETD